MIEGGPNRGVMGINRKGLHYAGSWEPKPAAHSFCNLASLIDDQLETKSFDARLEMQGGENSTQSRNTDSSRLRTYTLCEKATGSAVVVYWLAVPMQTEFHTEKVRINLAGKPIDNPVLVDLLDGRVYEVAQIERDDQTLFEGCLWPIRLLYCAVVICWKLLRVTKRVGATRRLAA